MFQEDVISDDEDDEFYLLPKEERNSQGAHKMTFNKKGLINFKILDNSNLKLF